MRESGDAGTPTLLILGAGGDLTRRLLLPGLASLLRAEPQRQVTVLGADRLERSDEQWRDLIRGALGDAGVSDPAAQAVEQAARYLRTDVLDPDAVAHTIAEAGPGPLIIYFALPPSVTVQVCELLASCSLPQETRLALEKPFGTDQASAHALNAQLHQVVGEEHIYRMDHFLGRSTIFNLIGLRFANRVLQPIWNSQHIEAVEIVYDEDLALEGRAGYYDHAGAARDMLQSHLLQTLAVFAMEPIATIEPEELHDLKSQVLRATRCWRDDPVASSRRARYTAGTTAEGRIPDYVDEDGVDPGRMTETLAQVTVEVCNQRWQGVPFTLRSGKALQTPRKQIVAHFRPVTHLPGNLHGHAEPDAMTIDLSPGALSLQLTMNAEDDPLQLEHKTLTANLADGRIKPYGEVLRDLLDGNPLLTVRGDGAEQCWRILDPVLAAWSRGDVAMDEYAAGSTGPAGWV